MILKKKNKCKMKEDSTMINIPLKEDKKNKDENNNNHKYDDNSNDNNNKKYNFLDGDSTISKKSIYEFVKSKLTVACARRTSQTVMLIMTLCLLYEYKPLIASVVNRMSSDNCPTYSPISSSHCYTCDNVTHIAQSLQNNCSLSHVTELICS